MPTKPKPMLIGAVLLAAGAGSRMGHRPKCLLELDGKPLIQRQLQALAEAGVAEVVLVLGHYADRIEAALDAGQTIEVRRVRNPDPDAGQGASLRRGLQTLQQPVDAVLVALADQPLIDGQDILDLIQAFKNRPSGKHMVQPTVDGLPGNPVIFSADVREHMLAASGPVGGQQWRAAHPGQVYSWTSKNGHYRQDVDTPADIAALVALGYPLSWPADAEAPSLPT